MKILPCSNCGRPGSPQESASPKAADEFYCKSCRDNFDPFGGTRLTITGKILPPDRAFLELRKQNLGYKEIARRLGCNRSDVYEALLRCGAVRSKGGRAHSRSR